jgi:hypothetical protein
MRFSVLLGKELQKLGCGLSNSNHSFLLNSVGVVKEKEKLTREKNLRIHQ